MFGLELLPQAVKLKEKLELTNRMLDPWGWNSKLRLPLGSTPRKMIFSEGGLQVYAYEPEPEIRRSTPVLIVPSLINRSYVLDLLPGKSVIEYMVKQGYPVYVLEWGVPEDEDRYMTFERFITGRLRRATSAVLKRERCEKVHLFGHCLGGSFGTVFAIRFPEMIASLTLLTAPVNFQVGGQLSVWSTFPGFDVDAYIDAYGNVPWSMMQMSFHMLKPAASATKYFKALRKVLTDGVESFDENFAQTFWAMEVWGADNVSYPGEFYKTLIKQFYRENALVNGSIEIDGASIRLEDMSFPVLNIAGREDHIVPPESTLTSDLLPKNSDVTLTTWVVDGGHIGCLLGRKAQGKLWPQMVNWLERQETPAT